MTPTPVLYRRMMRSTTNNLIGIADRLLVGIVPCSCPRAWWRSAPRHTPACRAERALDGAARHLRETARMVAEGDVEPEAATEMIEGAVRYLEDVVSDWNAAMDVDQTTKRR